MMPPRRWDFPESVWLTVLEAVALRCCTKEKGNMSVGLILKNARHSDTLIARCVQFFEAACDTKNLIDDLLHDLLHDSEDGLAQVLSTRLESSQRSRSASDVSQVGQLLVNFQQQIMEFHSRAVARATVRAQAFSNSLEFHL